MPQWTEEQQKVIDYRNRNILVSAAAGSGKTAVLVERIIQKITDEENPVDIDRLLVVTFTKAAAAEMRERIGAAIEKLEVERIENGLEPSANLERQSTLIHNAQITTIDSFCLHVVRNHFQEISLDPNFRIADEGEIKLLEQDVMQTLFEKNYAKEGNNAFLQLVDAYSTNRGSDTVKEMIKKIYRVSSSDPWPKEWIQGLAAAYHTESVEALCASPLMQEITDYIREILFDVQNNYEKIKHICLTDEIYTKYLQTIEADQAVVAHLLEARNYQEMQKAMSEIAFVRAATIKKEESKQAQIDRVKSIRDQNKEQIIEFRKQYFALELETLYAQIQNVRPYVDELIRLSLEYVSLLEEQKKQKRIVDFSDIEHFALQILVDGQTKEPTATAKEFQEQFEEIMIDEYQDSNQVQEAIMVAISGMAMDRNNMFMVGDVKQSIYRFRLARPELFMEKYKRFATEEAKEQRIDLHKNFRSRKEVVDTVNDIFFKLMKEDLGKVVYDEEAALYCGASYRESTQMETEILLYDAKDELLEDMEDYNTRQMEARMVATKIKQMKETLLVSEKDGKSMRPMRYSDVVILFRSLKGWGEDFAGVLNDCGIPTHVETSTGYFSAIEVQTVLNMLRILDNPYQDIPMAAVLHSPMVGLDNEEMAEIRVKDNKKSFAENALDYCEQAEEGKAKQFWEMYQRLRVAVCDTPIHELLSMIYRETGYDSYAASMPAGRKRSMNLDMLLQKAIAFEGTSYKGVFHFVRYIDQLQKYDVDFGDAAPTGEDEDVVHIMTIHKSKGLEFPVVFVSGMQKGFNNRDEKERMVVHSDLGIGLDEMSIRPRTKRKCLIRDEIANRMNLENLGEELRILYVALTRAKEKLILTGVFKDKMKMAEKYTGNANEGEFLSFATRSGAKNYMDWVIPALISYPGKYDLQWMEAKDFVTEEMAEVIADKIALTEQKVCIQEADEQLVKRIKESFEFKYPYVSEENRKSKYSVSELKHASMVQKYDASEGEAARPEFLVEERESLIPNFVLRLQNQWEQEMPNEPSGEPQKQRDIRETIASAVKGNQGALRGTAMHRVMEGLAFKEILALDTDNRDSVEAFVKNSIADMIQKEFLSQEMADLLVMRSLVTFVCSDTARRMALADEKGLLFKEKPFVMDYKGTLVQGIIDVFWMEENAIILLDYKTDRVSSAEELSMRYETQLNLYADALERIFTTDEVIKQVTEAMMYSFKLEETVAVTRKEVDIKIEEV